MERLATMGAMGSGQPFGLAFAGLPMACAPADHLAGLSPRLADVGRKAKRFGTSLRRVLEHIGQPPQELRLICAGIDRSAFGPR